ncbi:heme o synthase [Paenibacillus mucilaginosus]|uniref:Protoheme IX farnesyltransferase n=3 Tax=Paenibacillus mucilaginosus TaxID=61624 RepID=H6NBZ8_9BACL|nr:heme o synthase [Paenibacillus mucilaginosus]AEI42239.1 protoheme IX farnesyltransferase [Paenibacillus mucilaginosus KNP414]AFC28030.1 protoheme IX farnesyltransferase [Paenibacillus mucilaginosus 3016]AFH60199.1 protoheme IX farnesyltransferase [Paenibacillus mucilaginosus K02]MCG7214202.1 heme o synthase [Paenibacillus mucilaginosus]WDM28716.1 heme o synthase [Paenibacillus mucilaginosus]
MKDQASLDLGIETAAAASDPAAGTSAGWRDFVQLAKPGILFSNSMTAFGGFWVASAWKIDWVTMIFALLGTVLVMASGCVLNNYLDRDMDNKMERTQKRALVTGTISPQTVLWYGFILGVLGLATLWFGANPISALLGLIGLFLYVWIYTAWFKRTSVWSTFMGSFSGAVPPMIGYCAVTPELDAGAWILFGIMFLWQPPHFWALGIRRMEEYRAAGFPLLPVVRGTYVTKMSMIRYIVLLVPVSMLLYVYEYVNVYYFFAAAAMGLYWAFLCLKGYKVQGEEEVLWAKKMFIYSVNYLMLLFIIMIVCTTNGPLG